MSTDETRIDEASTRATAAMLRRHFDESFAAPAASRPEPVEDFLAIRVGTDPYALRLSEISGLHVGVKIVPVPSPAAQLLGIVGIRGAMAPVYDLAAILRYPPAIDSRWFVVVRGRQPVGFAFETFESHLQVPRASLADGNGEDPDTGGIEHHTRGAVRVAGALRSIIQLASVLKMIGSKHS